MNILKIIQEMPGLKIIIMMITTIRTFMAMTVISTSHMTSLHGATTFMDMEQGMGMELIILHMMNM